MPISHIQDGDSGLTARNILNQTIDVVNATTSSDAFPYTGSAEISGSLQVTGYISATEPIIGSLDGTASYADSSSFSLTASYVTSSNVLGPFGFDSVLSSSYSLTASYLEGYISPFPFTGSAIISGSLIVTGSIESSEGITGSLYGTASWAENSISSSYTISSSYSLQSISSSFANSSISSSYATTASYVTTAVPYSGATNDVDLGNYSLNAKNIHIKGTLGNGHLGLKFQSTTPTATANESSLFADSNGDIAWQNSNLYSTTLKTSANTANRIYTFPNRTGILADDTDLAGKQNSATILTTFSALANSAGWLYNNGSGILSYSTPTKTDIGLGNVTNSLQLVAANNLSDVVSASTSRINLGATTVGSNLFTATNSSVAVSWIRINADNTVTFLNANNTLNAILPSQGAGTINKFLQSDGTNTSWVSGNSGTVTSVAMTVPSFLSVSGSPITSSGTLAVTLSGTALPVANGGTGATSASITAFNNITGYSAAGATGTTSTNLVFSTSPTLVTPVIGAATGTSLDVTGALTSGVASSAAGTLVLRNATNAFTQTIRGTNPSASIIYDLPTTAPTAGQVLQSTAPSGGVATLSWATASSGAALSAITAATATNTINNVGYAQEWQWNTLAGSATAMKITTANASSVFSANKSLEISKSGTVDGAHSYGIYSSVANSGQTSGNTVAGFFLVTSGKNHVPLWSYGGNGANGASMYGLKMTSNNYGTNSEIIINFDNDTNAQSNIKTILASGGANTSMVFQTTASSTLADRFTIHSDGTYYFGNGLTASSPFNVVVNATGGSGTNVAGASLTIAAGKSTGNAVPADIIFQTSVAGSSGTTLQSLSESGRFINNQGLSLEQNTTTHSVFIGKSAGNNTATGSQNTAVGYQAGTSITTGTDNVCVGYLAGTNITTTSKQTFIGSEAGRYWGTYNGNNTAIGYQALLGSTTPANNIGGGLTMIGYLCGKAFTSGYYSTGIGDQVFSNWQPGASVCVGSREACSGGTYNSGTAITALGYGAMRQGCNGSENIAIGAGANWSGHTYSYTLFMGSSSSSSSGMMNTASNQVCIGMPLGGGYKDWYFGQGPTAQTTTYDITWQTTYKSGTNATGNDWIFIPTLGTGTGVGGNFIIKCGIAGGSGTTQNTATEIFRVGSTGITIGDAKDIILNTTTGTKIGTSTSQKLAFYNSTPIVQQTTGVATSTFVANTSGIVDDSATFGGYKISQIVKALQLYGLLA